jgi:hypothetical protein
MFDDFTLDDTNFLIYAMKAFEKPNAILSEFQDDIKRIKYIKRLIRRYRNGGSLKERLILNHIIILANIFGVEQSVKMLFFKLDKEDYSSLKTFLIYLSYMPDIVSGINGENIRSAEIDVDLNLADVLRKV